MTAVRPVGTTGVVEGRHAIDSGGAFAVLVQSRRSGEPARASTRLPVEEDGLFPPGLETSVALEFIAGGRERKSFEERQSDLHRCRHNEVSGSFDLIILQGFALSPDALVFNIHKVFTGRTHHNYG